MHTTISIKNLWNYKFDCMLQSFEVIFNHQQRSNWIFLFGGEVTIFFLKTLKLGFIGVSDVLSGLCKIWLPEATIQLGLEAYRTYFHVHTGSKEVPIQVFVYFAKRFHSIYIRIVFVGTTFRSG